MFMQAGRGVKANQLGVQPFPAPEVPTKGIDDAQAPFAAVWHFKHDGGTTPNKVTDFLPASLVAWV